MPLDDPLQHAEHAQQRADHDPRPPRTQRAVERDQHLDRAEDADAEHRADHVAHAACQQRAADHGRGDCIELHPLRLQPVSGQHVQREHHAAERRTEAAQRVDAHLRTCDRQPHQQRRALVAADRVHVAAEAREMRDVDRRGQRRERDQRARAQHAAADRHADARDRMEHRLVDRDRLRRDQEARAAREKHPGQRHDERLQPEMMNQRAHRRAVQRAEREHERHDHPHGPVQPLGADRAEDRGQRNDRADRQVDAARHDHERHPDRDDQQEGVVDEQPGQHLHREEARVHHGPEAEQRGKQHDRHDDRQRARVGEPAKETGHRGVAPVVARERAEGSSRDACRTTHARAASDWISVTTITTTALTTSVASGGTPIE
ncbi:hypothetical protein BLA39750_04858 [Burkholderia lata]|uniref:Uncharacterized protein n=1 Tax=Burkholderia lata (strain ATCC 17760 / DSM 23089 / LMG 22485 / NCIMB 9086 / R18194 / 383) TaxID=482957 RepID=A0A6P2ZFZ3_BURL3|nr:hypothetical protein BLA39750_04858 [Burkholderia lata]